MAHVPTVSEWMDKPPKTFRPTDDMRQAVNLLSKLETSSLPVVNDNGNMVGLLTKKDALRTIAAWSYEGIAGGTVADYMSPLRIQISPDVDLLAALRAFLECNFDCLPVTESRQLVGSLSRDKVLKGMVAWAATIDKDRDKKFSTPSEIERPSNIEEMQRVAASHTPDQLAEIFRGRLDE